MKTQAGGCSPPGEGARGAAQEWAEGGGEDAPCATRAVFSCFLSWVPDLISFLEEEEWGWVRDSRNLVSSHLLLVMSIFPTLVRSVHSAKCRKDPSFRVTMKVK